VRVRKTVSAATRAEVVRKLRKLQEQIGVGVLPDAATTGEWLTFWITEIAPRSKRRGKLIRERTLIGYRSYIDNWLTPHLGKIKLQQLTPDHVRSLYRAMRKAGKSETTITQAHAILHRALTVALKEGRVMRNAASIDDSPSSILNPTPHLTADLVTRVLAAGQTPRELCRLICAAVLALRQEEALGLQWPDFDERPGWVHVQRAVQRHPQRGLVVTDVKSTTSNRFVSLSTPGVADAFAGYRMLSGGEGWLFPGFKSGNPEDPRRDYEVWKQALIRAGVPHVPLRGARASAASAMRDAGTSAEIIADTLGHAKGSIKVAEESYIHTTTASQDEAMRKMAALPARQLENGDRE
jgi:integrase